MASQFCHVLSSTCPFTNEHLRKYGIWAASQLGHVTHVSLCLGLQGKPYLLTRNIAASANIAKNHRESFNALVMRMSELTAGATSSDIDSANAIVVTETVTDGHHRDKTDNETPNAIAVTADFTDKDYRDSTDNETANAVVVTEDVTDKDYRDSTDNETANAIVVKEDVNDVNHMDKNDDEKHSPETKPLKKIATHDLRIGALFKGRVSAIESYGAFVDIGADVEGFIHISRIGRSFVRSVEDVVHVGEEVLVQVVDLDLKANRISLMLRPDESSAQLLDLRLPIATEKDIIHKNAIRRSNKLARNTAQRRRMTVEARQRIKAYRRAMLAERMAIELRQAQIGFRSVMDDVDSVEKQKQVELPESGQGTQMV